MSTNHQSESSIPEDQLGGGGDLAELGDPHDEAVLQVARAAVQEHVVGGGPRAAQHDLGRGLGQVLVLGQVLRPVGQDAVTVLQHWHRLHHPDDPQGSQDLFILDPCQGSNLIRPRTTLDTDPESKDH